MEVKDEHMDQEISETHARLKKKLMKSTVLDSFTKLTSQIEKVRIAAGVNLLKHLSQSSDQAESEQKYALDRLVRGVGSSRLSAKTGFYTVLVAFLSDSNSITVDDVLKSINKHLYAGESNSKTENADIYMGQILVCGSLIHSAMFEQATPEEQTKIIQILVKAGNKRSYLTMASYTFIVEIIKKCNEQQFQTVMWPVMKPEVSKPWKEQNLDTIYFLSIARTLFPSVVKSKFINKILDTPEIVHEDSVKPLCEVLLNLPMLTSLKHPIYPLIGQQIAVSTVIPTWCAEMDQQLLKPTRNKHLVTTTFLTIILENMNDTTYIPSMLTNQFITVTLTTFKNTRIYKNKNDDFVNKMNKFFDILNSTLKKEEVSSKTKISVLKTLLFYPGTLIFEKITRSKLIQHITWGLNADGIKKLTKMYKEVVTAAKPRVIREDKTETWINMDRTYAAQLIVKLMTLPAVQKDIDWQMEQLKFFLKLGLFKSESNVGVELAATLKECFYRALDFKLPKLEDVRKILSTLVHHINEEIFLNDNVENLRTSLTEDGVEIWKDMMQVVGKLEEKKKFEQSYAVPVFHTLLLHMGLQLFSDFEMAQNTIKELHSCFNRLETEKQNKESTENEPVWIEVVIDLFLSLLSHNSYLLRSVIGCVFPYLCPHLSVTGLHQILDVLDPKNDENPLSKKNESSDDESDEDSAADSDSNAEEEIEEKESDVEDDGSDFDEILDENHEKNADKLRIALQSVLHNSSCQTDDESVDMDNMDEEEGQKLDEALAEAFKNVQNSKGKNTKQKRDDKTLTHFRNRALDLIEIYLLSEPTMLNCLEIAVPLLQILEFSIRDVHQKPLEHRIRTCLKRLTSIRKFSSTDGVNEEVLTDTLKTFLEKGSKNAFIYQDMGDKISECCIFIIRCSQILPSETSTPKKSPKKIRQSPIVQIYKNSLETFFNTRDCLLPVVLFKNALQISWDGNWALVPLLANYSFNNDIRPFRRSQALELLILFYSNNRFITADKESFKKHVSPIESTLSTSTIEFLKNLASNPNESKVKEKFISNLMLLLARIKSATASENIDWKTVGNCIREYRSRVTLANDAKLAYKKLCRAIGIPFIVKMQNTQVNGHVTEALEDETQSETLSQEELDAKKDKKRKKAKSLKQEKQKLKKEARLLRLKAGSEGLTEDIGFSNVSLTDIKMEEPNSSEHDTDNPDKQLNGSPNEINGFSPEIKEKISKSKKKRNNSESDETPRKKKNKKF